MKKLILFFHICFLFAKVGLGQPGLVEYDTCSAIKQYEGEWLSTNSQDTIKIYLRYHRQYSQNFHFVSDNLYGWIEYKRGATIVESTYEHRFDALPFYIDTNRVKYSILLWKSCDDTSAILRGTIIDFSQAKELHNVKATVNAITSEIDWEQQHREGYGLLTGATGMTLPRQFTLVKQ